MTSKPLVRRTLATLRSAEFGFFGVVVYTRVQTPRRKGFDLSAGDFSFLSTSRRLRRTSWLIVGIKRSGSCCRRTEGLHGVRKKSRHRPRGNRAQKVRSGTLLCQPNRSAGRG